MLQTAWTCLNRCTLRRVQMSKQRCNLEGAGNQTKKKGYSSSLPSFSLRNGIMILLYLYMYALYASDSAKSGRRTSLVLVSTVSNNPVGNRQSTFMDMSAAKKKDLLFLSSSSLLFLGKKKKRELEPNPGGIEDGWYCARYVHPMCAIQSSWNRLSRDPSTFLPILQHI